MTSSGNFVGEAGVLKYSTDEKKYRFAEAGFAFGGLVSPLVGLGDMLTTTGIVFLAGSLLSFFFAAFATKK